MIRLDGNRVTIEEFMESLAIACEHAEEVRKSIAERENNQKAKHKD